MAPNLPPKNRGGTPPAKTTDAFGGKSFNGDGKDPEYPGDGVKYGDIKTRKGGLGEACAYLKK
jgi:hypothetical protein